MYEDEDMYLYVSDDFEPEDSVLRVEYLRSGRYDPPECDEGELRWIPADELMSLPMWEGDRVFLQQILDGKREISMTLQYTGESCTVLD